VSNHIGRSEVVHDELKFLLLYPFTHLLGNTGRTHLRSLVVGRYALVGWNKILGFVSGLEREHLLYTSVEEEGYVCVLLGFGDMDLINALCAEGFGKNVAHVLWLEGDFEGVIELVLSHGCESDVLGVWEVGLGGSVDVSEELSDLTDSIGAVVEEEDLVTICKN
jgi:hypothetical protein